MIVTHPLMLYIDLTGSGTWTAGLFALPGTEPSGHQERKGNGVCKIIR